MPFPTFHAEEEQAGLLLSSTPLAVGGCCSAVSEMKSIQPYSTRDEYIYAMKEDLAEWFNSMYHAVSSSSPLTNSLTALNFTDELENGVLICFHANCVMKYASSSSASSSSHSKQYVFNAADLSLAGIVNTTSLLINASNANPQVWTFNN